MEAFAVQPLASHHDRAAFSCGVDSLDRYIHQQARQDDRRDLASCYILSERQSTRIIGYYTLSATSIRLNSLPPERAKAYGRYPDLSAVLIGRLAVDARYRGLGMGEILLLHALRQSLRARALVGVVVVVVDAVNDAAAGLHQRYGFAPFPDDSMRLYLSVSEVRDLFAHEG